MKYGILGDIHSNLSALEKVLGLLDEEQVDELISVGDVVGYGAAPKECIRLLRERGVWVVQGNHDAACVGALDDRYFNPYARAAVQWTREHLDADELDWLRSLPLTLEREHCQVAHGTLFRPELFDYVLSPTDANPSLEVMTKRVAFVGHSHIPIGLLRFRDAPRQTAYTTDPEIDLSNVERALINVGSVGQPRDEEPRTAYALYDTERDLVRIQRTSYDIEREASRIREAGLPEVLAERLSLGI